MSDFRRKFTSIEDRPTVPRLPRLGYIRLGKKVQKQNYDPGKCVMKDKRGKCQGCWNCTYPKETDYFVCPDVIRSYYGDTPNELRVMLPIDDERVCFTNYYVYYGMSRGWKCMGNGKIADRVNPETGEINEVTCPGPEACSYHYDKKGNAQCSLQATLQVIVLDHTNHPIGNTWGVYWVRTTSETSRIDIISGMRFLQKLAGRIALIPLVLRRVETVFHRDGKREKHWTLQLIPVAPVDQLAFYRANPNLIYTGPNYCLPEPEVIHPATQGDPVVIETDDVNDAESDKFCEKCGQAWAVHNDDGSCVVDIGENVETGHAENCTCEICMADHDTAPKETPEENGDLYSLYAKLQQEIADLAGDPDKTVDDITKWQKENVQRINKLPVKSDDQLNQPELLKVVNAAKRKKRNAEQNN